MQLQIESEALKKETDKDSAKRLKKTKKTLADLEEQKPEAYCRMGERKERHR